MWGSITQVLKLTQNEALSLRGKVAVNIEWDYIDDKLDNIFIILDHSALNTSYKCTFVISLNQ